MAKDRRIRLSDREIQLTRDALELIVNHVFSIQSTQEVELRAILARFDNIKSGGQFLVVRDARKYIRGEGCPESKS